VDLIDQTTFERRLSVEDSLAQQEVRRASQTEWLQQR
jgi:hypothetical protein